MNFFQRISKAGRVLLNSHPENSIYEPSVYTYGDSFFDNKMVDLSDTVPYVVRPTLHNFRFASHDPQVRGILIDNVTKSNTNYTIKATSDKAENLLREYDRKYWNLSNQFDNDLMNGMIDGDIFYQIYYKDNIPLLYQLAYDGIKYKIKVVFDDYGKPRFYKHLTEKNVGSTAKSKKYDELENTLEEGEVTFNPEEIMHCKYMEQNTRGTSLVSFVIEPVYYKRILKRQLPLTAFKASNLLKVIVGNNVKPGMELTKKDSDGIAKEATDYHKKGVVQFPFGIDAELLNAGALPDIPSYIDSFEKDIYKGLSAPEVIFSSESSNRSTGQVQMDSPLTGRVLFLQYNQEWLDSNYSRTLFRQALDLADMEDERGWIVFDPLKNFYPEPNKIDVYDNRDTGIPNQQTNNNYNDYNNPYKPPKKEGIKA